MFKKWFGKSLLVAVATLTVFGTTGCGDETIDDTMVSWFAYWGNKSAQSLLGARYYFGDGVPKDPKKAVYWWRKAAEQGHAKAQYYLGVCYENGEGVPKDPDMALVYYFSAAEQGYDEAKEVLKGRRGELTKIGDALRAKGDYNVAFKLYKTAADLEFGQACCRMGECYENGWGVAKDPQKAVEWYRKGAILENVPAKNRLKELGY